MDEYEIIDEPSGNLVRTFPTEEAALEMVRRVVKQQGAHSVDAWAMGRTDLTGPVLSGRALMARACGIQV